MSYRYMRVLVLFDLPTVTIEDRKSYVKFRKYLIKNGFMMLQESVYCKLALNSTVANAISAGIKTNKPEAGLVQLLVITEKQFSKMEFITGSKTSDILDTDERLVVF